MISGYCAQENTIRLAGDGGSGLATVPSCSVDGNAATLTASGSGTWTFPVSGDGQHAVSCQASDDAGNQGSASDIVEVYDPAADRWQRVAPIPAARDHAMAAALGGKVVLVNS